MGLKRYSGSDEAWGRIVSVAGKYRIGDSGKFLLLALYELGLLPGMVRSEHTLEGRVGMICSRYRKDRERYLEYIRTGQYAGRVRTLKLEGKAIDFLKFFCSHGGRKGMGYSLDAGIVQREIDRVESRFNEEE